MQLGLLLKLFRLTELANTLLTEARHGYIRASHALMTSLYKRSVEKRRENNLENVYRLEKVLWGIMAKR